MKRHLPNSITCCNLLCGCAATHFALQGNTAMAFTLIVAGAVFDFFDGFAARLLKVSSPIGKELDSLADVITFGFAPAAIVFSMIHKAGGPTWLPYAAFLIAAFSALRLAKFNLDERQAMGFLGLPTPANALFWASASLWLQQGVVEGRALLISLIIGILISCWLLVSEIPMFALKFKTFKIKDNELRYSFLVVSAVLIALLRWNGFALIIPLYILVSLANNLRKRH